MNELWGCGTDALRAFASVARGHLSTLDRTAALLQREYTLHGATARRTTGP